MPGETRRPVLAFTGALVTVYLWVFTYSGEGYMSAQDVREADIAPDDQSEKGISGIETRSYEFVPLSERHGKPVSLFWLWFGEQFSSFTLVTGSLAVVLGLNFWWAIVAIVLGNLIGALFMAGHSAQGPVLGLPQMIQSRAQFGFYGTLLPLCVTWCMYIAFSAVAVVIAGKGFYTVFGGNEHLWIGLSVIPIFILAVVGYDLIHSTIKWVTAWMGATMLVILGLLIAHGIPAHALSQGHFSWAAFMMAISLTLTWQLTYAPYVSDYSRYIPPRETRGAFWFTYVGTTLSAILVMILGAAVCTLAPAADVVNTVQKLTTSTALGDALVVILAVGLIVVNSTNIYGGTISTLTLVQHFRSFKSTSRKRIAAASLIAALAALVGIAGSGNFLTNLQNYLNFVLYFLIPWTAINLTDFYILHHGHYHTDDFFSKTGPFGRWGGPAIISYFVTFIVQIPFMDTTVFTGPIAHSVGGIDLAWVIGPVVSVPLYLYLAKRKLARKQEEAHRQELAAAELAAGPDAGGAHVAAVDAPLPTSDSRR
jgi:NCS1 family nucleobase:cation symporter-1